MAKYLAVTVALERLAHAAIVFLVISHVLACAWIFIANDAYVHDSNNWVWDNDFQNQSRLDLYVTSIYFVITTMTTVGYGDISPTNT